MRTIEVKSADGIIYVISFHRTAAYCWQLEVSHATGHRYESTLISQIHASFRADRVLFAPDADKALIQSTSLERLMSFLAVHIGETEF